LKIGVIGRTEILFRTLSNLRSAGHEIVHIVTAKEAPEYSKTSADFRKLADKWNVPFIHTPRIVEAKQTITEVSPDIGISVNYPGIIPQEVIDLFPHGILNVHGGDLPRYRGNACQAWAILNGEQRIGLCVHKMIGGELDSGDIITRDYLQIDHTTKITKVWDWMTERVPALMLEAVEQLSKDTSFVLESQSRDSTDALRCYPRRPEDGRIDWRQNAIDVLRLINASNKPYAGAFCEFEGNKMIIWDAELVDEQENYCATPGQVTLVGESFVEVACQKGKLKLKEVEIKGETGPPEQWFKSIRKRLQ
jgi:UDP-4-amino-4-deoxy-L-arabinose formyltransferase/UDP-glucuronic acid dehydrogenase (UDP-4-keto-hexauronic acid decarboxylating)